MKNWRKGIVMRGDQTGRTLGFPTVNFDPKLAHGVKKPGVYAADVVIHEVHYRGALYFGPRLTLGEKKRVLEIHLLDFSGDIYGQTVQFRVGAFIRPPMNFTTEGALKDRLADDILAVRGASI